MMTLRQMLSNYLGAISLNKSLGVAVVAGQVALLLDADLELPSFGPDRSVSRITCVRHSPRCLPTRNW